MISLESDGGFATAKLRSGALRGLPRKDYRVVAAAIRRTSLLRAERVTVFPEVLQSPVENSPHLFLKLLGVPPIVGERHPTEVHATAYHLINLAAKHFGALTLIIIAVAHATR
jgi:hypothetical protein